MVAKLNGGMGIYDIVKKEKERVHNLAASLEQLKQQSARIENRGRQKN